MAELKTAADLGISETEYCALVKTLHAMENGKIKEENIDMRMWGCGTTHCIAGWANTIDNEAFPEISPLVMNREMVAKMKSRIPRALSALFGLDNISMTHASPTKAIRALRNYLQSGTYRGK